MADLLSLLLVVVVVAVLTGIGCYCQMAYERWRSDLIVDRLTGRKRR